MNIWMYFHPSLIPTQIFFILFSPWSNLSMVQPTMILKSWSSFHELVPYVDSSSCSWLTRLALMWSSAFVAPTPKIWHLVHFEMLFCSAQLYRVYCCCQLKLILQPLSSARYFVFSHQSVLILFFPEVRCEYLLKLLTYIGMILCIV